MRHSSLTTKQFIFTTLLVTTLLLVVDRVTKFFATQYFLDPYVLIPNVLELSFFGNVHFLFYWKFPMWIVVSVLSMVMVFLVWQWVDAVKEKKYIPALLLSILFVGAISNIYDRLFLGYVIDFIRVPFWSVWNFADMYIIGAVLALGYFLWHSDKKSNEDTHDRE